MPRLIDKDELKKAIQENICQVICDEPRGCSCCRVDDVWEVIYEQPTVAEKHGHWIDENGMFLCSECGDSWGTEMEAMVRSFNFCPNCGAKMDEVENDECKRDA